MEMDNGDGKQVNLLIDDESINFTRLMIFENVQAYLKLTKTQQNFLANQQRKLREECSFACYERSIQY